MESADSIESDGVILEESLFIGLLSISCSFGFLKDLHEDGRHEELKPQGRGHLLNTFLRVVVSTVSC